MNSIDLLPRQLFAIILPAILILLLLFLLRNCSRGVSIALKAIPLITDPSFPAKIDFI